MEPEAIQSTESTSYSSPLRRWLYLFAGLVFGGIFLYMTARNVDLNDAMAAIYAANPMWLLPLTLIFILNTVLRSVRWRLMFPDDSRPSLRHTLDAFLIGKVANNVMPGKLGELLRASIIGKFLPSIGVSGSLATIVLEKVIDALAILLLLGLALLLAPLPAWVASSGLVMIVTFPLLLIVLVIVQRVDGRIFHSVQTDASGSILTKLKILLRTAVKKFSAGLYALRNTRHFIVFSVFTLLIWSWEVITMFLCLQAFSITVPFSAAIVSIVFLVLGSMLPSAPGLVGTYQLFIVSALQLYAVSDTSAFALAVFLNMYVIVMTTGLGLAAVFFEGGLFNLRQVVAAVSRST
jgi:glycosyltransferase 2 family protein